jgi:CheY-like chemotaxis protein
MLSPTVLLGRTTVLVVDDEQPLREYLSRVLEDDGYHVLTARDGIEALTLMEGGGTLIQLVITDISMPRMTGTQLADHLAAQPGSPPLLFISGGYVATELARPLLTKPFTGKELSAVVRRLLTGGREPLPVSSASHSPGASTGP